MNSEKTIKRRLKIATKALKEISDGSSGVPKGGIPYEAQIAHEALLEMAAVK